MYPAPARAGFQRSTQHPTNKEKVECVVLP